MQALEFEVVEDGRVVTISVRLPTEGVRRQGERVYRRALQRAVSAGQPPRQKVLERIDDLWGAGEQTEYERLFLASAADLVILAEGQLPVAEGRVVAERLRHSRAERRKLRAEVDALERETAEAVAIQTEFDFLVAACTFRPCGARYFSDTKAYLAVRAQNHPVAHKAYWALAGELLGLREDFEDTLPENVYLRQPIAC